MQTFAERFEPQRARRVQFAPNRILLQDPGYWAGTRLEIWESQPQSLPESVLFQHALLVNLIPKQSEIRWSGHRPISGTFAPGTVSVLPAGLPYQASSPANSRTLVLALRPEMLGAVRPETRNAAVELVPRYGVEDTFVRSACEALAEDVSSGSPMGSLYGEALIAAIRAHVLRHHVARPEAGQEGPPGRRALVLDYVHAHVADPLTLAELAAVCQLDVFAFCRWFKSSFGLPPYRYVMRVRVDRAKVLLRQADTSVVEVAMSCGFGSQSHFALCFRRAVGMTPSAYRAECLAAARSLRV